MSMEVCERGGAPSSGRGPPTGSAIEPSLFLYGLPD